MCMYDNCINILVEALLFSDTLPLLVIRSFLLQSLTSKAPIRAPLLSLIRKISASHLLKAKEVEFPTTTHHITSHRFILHKQRRRELRRRLLAHHIPSRFLSHSILYNNTILKMKISAASIAATCVLFATNSWAFTIPNTRAAPKLSATSLNAETEDAEEEGPIMNRFSR